MVRNYFYDHSGIRLTQLQKLGIRAFSELEDVIEGESFWENGINDVKIATGFNKNMRAMLVAFKLDGLTIVTLDARIATIDEVKSDFCKYCPK